MALIFENVDRRVIPNWRSFTKTSLTGEISSVNDRPKLALSINNYIEDWKINKKIPFAGELISAAITNNQITSNEVKDAANFILDNKKKVSNALLGLAQSILHNQPDNLVLNEEKEDYQNLFECIFSKNNIFSQIQKIKKRIITFPYNPILYVELSRNYITIGQNDQAVNAMNTALHLAPNNRFVLRSAARLFIHIGETDKAHYILKRCESIYKDPWIMASEISVATLLNINSRNIKKGFEILSSNNFLHNSISELSSSIATIEFINGSFKKSRKLFEQSLIDPNDNSLAQAEWANSKFLNINTNSSNINSIRNISEAKALSCFLNKDYKQALYYASDWVEDMQFAKRPILFASSISTSHLKDYKLSEKILKIGIDANPNDAQLINNIAYAYALDNDVDNADKYLGLIKSSTRVDEAVQICLLATKGLVHFRRGYYDSGRSLYLNAIEKATKLTTSPKLNWVAILNYIREELLINSEYCEQIIGWVDKIKEEDGDDVIKELKKDIRLLIDRRK